MKTMKPDFETSTGAGTLDFIRDHPEVADLFGLSLVPRADDALSKLLVALRFSTNLVVESLRHPGKGFVISTDTGEIER